MTPEEQARRLVEEATRFTSWHPGELDDLVRQLVPVFERADVADLPFTEDTLRIGARIMADIRACDRAEDSEGFCTCARGFLRWIQTMRAARTSCREAKERAEATVARLREDVLEEASRIADTAYGDPNWHLYYRHAASNIAAKIRALAATEEKL